MSGTPIWYELMTPDPAAVAPFYRAVLGWEIPAEGHDMPNGSQYREVARAGGGPTTSSPPTGPTPKATTSR